MDDFAFLETCLPLILLEPFSVVHNHSSVVATVQTALVTHESRHPYLLLDRSILTGMSDRSNGKRTNQVMMHSRVISGLMVLVEKPEDPQSQIYVHGWSINYFDNVRPVMGTGMMGTWLGSQIATASR